MLTLFQLLANKSLASLENADPYLLSHPMPLERIRNLELEAKKSAFFDKDDAPQLLLAPSTDAGQAGRLHAIAAVCLPALSLIGQEPAGALCPLHFDVSQGRHEECHPDHRQPDQRYCRRTPISGSSRARPCWKAALRRRRLPPLRQANKLLPNSGLIQILYAQALIATENRANIKQALNLLTLAKKTERDSVDVYKYSALAYGYLNDLPRAELATAEMAMLQGDTALASEKAKRVIGQFKHGSPEWIKANDILNFTNKERN